MASSLSITSDQLQDHGAVLTRADEDGVSEYSAQLTTDGDRDYIEEGM